MINFLKHNWHKTTALLLLAAGLFYVAFEFDFSEPRQQDTIPNKTANVDTQSAYQPPPESENRDTLERILSNSQYQKVLPNTPKPQNQKPVDFPRWLAVALKWIFIVGGIAAIATFIWLLVSSMTGGYAPPSSAKKKVSHKAVPKQDKNNAVSSPVSLQDAEDMAAKGDYGEAIHLMLLALLQHLSKLDVLRLRPSLTSREILRSSTFNQEATHALQFLIGAVESYLFAKITIDAKTYQNCRTQYDTLIKEAKHARAGAQRGKEAQ
ncbi:hypothetical protein [Kordiimonas sp. SCSIO 12610]|uniref:hypothetical protein n=1 Tax=Kordiimonas sp. SCSIO 12610 TaxID=2829597 RepID=UPI00210A338F|nr:hypothetical protein [Kordiimonas sp. SCSIO 12610]UTW56331.1 hypothetical protein KFF44_05355 [Kordiimonas sp. SCSIO 12610]